MTRKRETVIFIMVASMLLGASTAYAETRDCFFTGNKLMKLYEDYSKALTVGTCPDGQCEINLGEFFGYCTGVVDGVMGQYDIPVGTNQLQIVAIFIGYLEAHPEEGHCCAAFLVIKAIQQAYPKKKGR